ncbi:MAG: TetR family transcriptional regulator [Clostridia bacterium]|nr:TetR family transcriptional regulator [Clostridia bacterium]
MKKLTEKSNVSSARTCKILQIAMETLLEQKPFNNIFVKDICEEAKVPRATFYNHFEDKYDLLSFCLLQLEKELEPAEDKYFTSNEYYSALLSNAADFCIENKIFLRKVSKLNNNNVFISELQNHIATLILAHIRDKNKKKHLLRIPAEIVAEYYSGALIAMLKWWINCEENWSKDDLLKGADILLNRKQELYY